MSMYETAEYGAAPGLQEWEVYEAYAGASTPVFESDELELELTQQLMEVTSEAELEEFIGNLIRGAVRTAGRFVRSPVGRMVGGVLRGVAKSALPAIGGAVGSFVAPGVGTVLGGQLGSMASSLLEAEELEVLAEEEAEFEAGRRFVRFARATARNAARAPRNRPPQDVARNAAVSAAQRYAPALLRSSGRVSPWRQRRRPPERRPREAWADPGYAWVDAGSSAPGDPYAGAGYDAGFADGDDAADASGGSGPAPNGQGTEGETGRWERRPDGILLVGA